MIFGGEQKSVYVGFLSAAPPRGAESVPALTPVLFPHFLCTSKQDVLWFAVTFLYLQQILPAYLQLITPLMCGRRTHGYGVRLDTRPWVLDNGAQRAVAQGNATGSEEQAD